MQIDFLESKDGSKTFSANGIFYHSTYSPLKEAQRFIDSYQFLFEPKIIFFVEPGLNYFSNLIKQKFNKCKVVCIRMFEQSFEDENTWDFVIQYNKTKRLSQFLINTFGEELLLSSTVLIWKPSETLFKDSIKDFILQYKTTLESCKTLLVTRQFFEKKWLINSCNFIVHSKNYIEPVIKTKLPVIICASGPSLEPCLEIIKNFRKSIFVLCLSSALSVLVQNNITPDLILSTDGGYWAGEHLKVLKKNPDVTLAVPCEAFIPKTILHKNKILPLCYDDQSSFICSDILNKAKLPALKALRNPTVSGTALYLAKSITDNCIFFCGLNLAGAKGFQHSQPNELEKNNELIDSRIRTKDSRISRSRYNSESLEIYRDWFSLLPSNEVQNVYRVIQDNSQSSLGNIKDIDFNKFFDKLKNYKSLSKDFKFTDASFIKTNPKEVLDFVIEKLSDEKWNRQIFPADYISIQNCPDENEKTVLLNRLNEKTQKLIQKIRLIADE